MKCFATYDPVSDNLQIAYGLREQRDFREASRLIRTF